MTTRAVLKTIVAIAILAVLSTREGSAQEVIAEISTASIRVGIDPVTKRSVLMDYFIIGEGPYGVHPSAGKQIIPCVWNALDVAHQEMKRLDSEVDPWSDIPQEIIDYADPVGQPLNAATIMRRQQLRVDATSKVLAQAKAEFFAYLGGSKCQALVGRKEIIPSLHFGIVLRYCFVGDKYCGSDMTWSANRAPSARVRSRFAKLYEWVAAQGIRAANEPTEIADSGLLGRPLTIDAFKTEWRAIPSAAVNLQSFELLVEDVRKSWGPPSRTRIDYIVPGALALPRAQAIHIADVLDSPAWAIQNLRAAQSTDPIPATISDEIARSRIKNCVQFLAKGTNAQIGECAGLTLTDQGVYDCMNDRRCWPVIADKGLAVGMSLEQQKARSQIRDASYLPRIALRKTAPELDAIFAACKDGRQDYKCVLKAAGSPEAIKGLDCVGATNLKASARSCLTAAIPADNKVARCVAENEAVRDALVCAAPLSDDQRRALKCYQSYAQSGSKSGFASCLASMGLSDQDQKLLACAEKYKGEWRLMALCSATTAESDKKEVTQSLECAQSAGQSYKTWAGCMVAQNTDISGDLGKIAVCAARSGGDYLTTAACSSDIKLTEEQQIVLQCASQSPDGYTFAACVGGQLAVKEYMQCQGSAFGKGRCFGENNEIRKFVRNMGMGDITDTTVVGQAGNLYLEYVRGYVGLAEAEANAVKDVGSKAIEEAGSVVRGVGDAAAALGKGVESVADGARNFVKSLGF